VTTKQAGVAFRGRNPDVLTCIANLSNDEVFTPPELANKMLDAVAAAWAANTGADIWSDASVRFLDPFTKSGVFLREVTRRLTSGLESAFPNLDERVDHILTKQVFGIAITHLTSLLARRSVYCSKFADGEHSVAKSFTSDVGNIVFERIEHTWIGATEFEKVKGPDGKTIKRGVNGRCEHCGASQKALDRGAGFETHAYSFIHTDDIKAETAELFGDDMQFDVIVGNPPYQLADGGGNGTSATPIYNLFVEQAKKLEPRLLTMVIPSRWFTGGRGLDDFRASMLSDGRVRSIDDYVISADVFPNVALKGGVCYFLWDRDHPGKCRVTTHFKDAEPSTTTRPLLEKGAEVFIRFNQGLTALKKVAAIETGSGASLALPEEAFWACFNLQRQGQSLYGRSARLSERRDGLHAEVVHQRRRAPHRQVEDLRRVRSSRDRKPRHVSPQGHQHTVHRGAGDGLVRDVSLHRSLQVQETSRECLVLPVLPSYSLPHPASQTFSEHHAPGVHLRADADLGSHVDGRGALHEVRHHRG
jgi:adenine-specific DNA methylase